MDNPTKITPSSIKSDDGLKHSGVGIASFSISIVGSISTVASFTAAAMIASGKKPEELIKHPYPGQAIVGFVILLTGAAFIIGVILGIIGILQKDRKKTFSTLGLAFNGAALLLILGTFVLGTMAMMSAGI